MLSSHVPHMEEWYLTKLQDKLKISYQGHHWLRGPCLWNTWNNFVRISHVDDSRAAGPVHNVAMGNLSNIYVPSLTCFFFFFGDVRSTCQCQSIRGNWPPDMFFYQIEGRFHSRESNRQPLPWELGISPSPSNSLRPSWTRRRLVWLLMFIRHLYEWQINK